MEVAALRAAGGCAAPQHEAAKTRAGLRVGNPRAPSFARAGGSLKGAAMLLLAAPPPEPGNSAMTISPHDIARVLCEALPHMQRYDEEIVVVKYGGHAMGEEETAKSF